MKATRRICWAATLALLGLWGCSRNFERRVQEQMDNGDVLAAFPGGFDPERMDAGPLPAVPPELAAHPLVFVVPPFYVEQPGVDAAQALQQWLQARVGVPVLVQSPSAYAHDALAAGLKDGSIDLADLSPYGFALMEERGVGAQALVAAVANGSSSYASYLVVRRGSPIVGVDDIRGKRVAFVDPLSTSGYLLPSLFLKQHGFDLEKDVIASFAGTHTAAVQLVRDGSVDVAAVSSDLLVGNSGLAGPLRVIAKAGRIPYDVIVARPGLDPALAARVRAALLRLSIHDESGRVALKAFSAADGFMPVPAAVYDDVRALAHSVRAQGTTTR